MDNVLVAAHAVIDHDVWGAVKHIRSQAKYYADEYRAHSLDSDDITDLRYNGLDSCYADEVAESAASDFVAAVMTTAVNKDWQAVLLADEWYKSAWNDLLRAEFVASWGDYYSPLVS